MADIFGQDGQNDTLAGGVFGTSAVDDRLFGGTGNDTYTFTEFSGFDLISDAGGIDRVLFDNTVTQDRVRLSTTLADNDDSLMIHIIDAFENIISRIEIDRVFSTIFVPRPVESMVFADGTTVNLMGGLTFQGAIGETRIKGTSLGDRMIFSARNEEFWGGTGNDTYAYAAGDEFDEVFDSGGIDRLEIAGDISRDRVRFNTDIGQSFGNSLYVMILDEFDNEVGFVKIEDHFAGAPVESLSFADGTVVNLMGGLTIQGHAALNTLTGTAQGDRFIGSTRSEFFSDGGGGNDTYVFANGFGEDGIRDSGGIDTIQLNGIAAGRVALRPGGGLFTATEIMVLAADGTVESRIRMNDFSGTGRIETLQIGSETFSIAAQLAGPVTTGGGDIVGSFLGNTLIEGQGGNDRITDLYGSNTLNGGSGDDRLTTGAGNDVLTGGTGRDVLIAGAGNDRLDGGAKADRLTGDRGADQFAFARGTGADVVTDFGTGADVLVLDNSLWAGRLTARQVVNRFATDTGDDVVFDFGARGEITLDGLGSLRGLAGDIDIG